MSKHAVSQDASFLKEMKQINIFFWSIYFYICVMILHYVLQVIYLGNIAFWYFNFIFTQVCKTKNFQDVVQRALNCYFMGSKRSYQTF
jgi:hypothetical protein